MISFLEGILAEKHPTRVVLDVHGVGYEVFIPLSSYDRLPLLNQSCRILTHQYVREDDLRLFGFVTEAERKMFLLLMGVNGIGPKTAISTLSGMTVRELRKSIVDGDVKRLSSISGIGRKTAERMVVELKDKMDVGDVLEAAAGGSEATQADSAMRDAALALVALGYKQEQATKMVVEVLQRSGAASLSVEEIIKKALGG